MGKKYILEIEDQPFVSEGNYLYRVKGFRSLVFDGNGLCKLRSAENEWRRAYNKGYCEADKKHLESYHDVYGKGQFDAWLTARRITTLCAWNKEVACLIFGTTEPEEIMRRNSVQGAQTKLNEYDEAQKEGGLGIRGYFKNGEEVIDADGTKAVILRVSEDNYCQVYTENGCIENWHIHTYKFHKTGKTHPEVESMLANMRRENEG